MAIGQSSQRGQGLPVRAGQRSRQGSLHCGGGRSVACLFCSGQALDKTDRLPRYSVGWQVLLGQALDKTCPPPSPLVGRGQVLLGQALDKTCPLPPRYRPLRYACPACCVALPSLAALALAGCFAQLP